MPFLVEFPLLSRRHFSFIGGATHSISEIIAPTCFLQRTFLRKPAKILIAKIHGSMLIISRKTANFLGILPFEISTYNKRNRAFEANLVVTSQGQCPQLGFLTPHDRVVSFIRLVYIILVVFAWQPCLKLCVFIG